MTPQDIIFITFISFALTIIICLTIDALLMERKKMKETIMIQELIKHISEIRSDINDLQKQVKDLQYEILLLKQRKDK